MDRISIKKGIRMSRIQDEVIEQVREMLLSDAFILKSNIYGGNAFIYCDKEHFEFDISKLDKIRELSEVEGVTITYDMEECLMRIGIYFKDNENEW